MNLPLFVSRNGELVPAEGACVPLRQPALLNAFGVYETVQVSQGVPFHLADHLSRMAFSARQIELELPAGPETIGTWVSPLLAANGAPECLLKFLVLGPGEGYVYPGQLPGAPSGPARRCA